MKKIANMLIPGQELKLEKNKHRYGIFTILKTCIFDQIIKQSNLTSKTLPHISTLTPTHTRQNFVM